MVNVGILGLGPDWETRHRPALEALRERIRIRCVFDAVFNLAEQAAAGYHASTAAGIQALLEQPDLQAILLLDTAWYGPELLEFVCRGNKPVYIGGSLDTDVRRMWEYHERACARGLTLMPEFSRRYTPASSRLQELIATDLGPPHHLVIETPAPPLDAVTRQPGFRKSELLVELFDWCCYVVRTAPVSVEAHLPQANPGADVFRHSMTVTFRRPRSGSEPPRAELHISGQRADLRQGPSGVHEDPISDGDRLAYEVCCERGHARIASPVDITWTSGSEERSESLKSERCETEVMLDHFCRRVVGGLIPVADLGDVCRSLTLVQAAEESLDTGRAAVLNGQT